MFQRVEFNRMNLNHKNHNEYYFQLSKLRLFRIFAGKAGRMPKGVPLIRLLASSLTASVASFIIVAYK